jgi:hypothetical protein
MGNVPISGIPRGPANAGGMNNATVDPSGIGNAARMATLPQPQIAAPTQPGGLRNPIASPSMNVEPQPLGEVSGGHSQPRADQVPSEKSLTNPNDPANRQNAAFDRMLNICRGCWISAPPSGAIESGEMPRNSGAQCLDRANPEKSICMSCRLKFDDPIELAKGKRLRTPVRCRRKHHCAPWEAIHIPHRQLAAQHLLAAFNRKGGHDCRARIEQLTAHFVLNLR